jgi:molybdopterin-synthase adenylyltransferase
MPPDDNERYSRQVLFPGIGEAGQVRIQNAIVAIVGCGALGSFQAEALARAGVGRLRLIDRDYVDYTNLQRQWLYDETDARNESPKAIAAARRLHQINRHVLTEPLVTDLSPSNAEELIAQSDLILDGTDNLETRYLLNDLSVKLNIPWIYGAAIASYGVVMPVLPERGPCFACVYPDLPAGAQPACDVNGVLAAATASVASLQVALALRLLVGSEPFSCHIQTLDVWTGAFRQLSAGPRDPSCRVCGARQFDFLDNRRRVPVSLCGRNAVQLHEHTRTLNLRELADRLRPLGDVRVNEFALRLSLEKYQLTFFPDGRAIVKGTTDVGVARGVYARLIGA